MTIVIVLGILSCLTVAFPQQVVSQFTTTRVQLDLGRVRGYVKNLIDSYNFWVDEYDKPRRDFPDIKAYFSLYLELGNSFKVIVIQTDLYDTQISLIFTRIRANQLDVIVDYKDSFWTLFPNMSEVKGYTVIQSDLPFTYNGTIVRQDFILGIKAADISGDYMTNSYNTAQYIYHEDQNQIPTISQTQTVTKTSVISQEQATGVQTSQSIFRTLIYIAGGIAGAVLVAITIAVMYFGSGKDFVKFLVDEREQKGVMGDVKKLFRLLFRRNKKKRVYTSSAQNVSEINRKILSALLLKGPLRTVVLSNKIDLSVTSTSLHLTQLEKDGFVISTHSIIGRYWSVTTKGKDLFKLKI